MNGKPDSYFLISRSRTGTKLTNEIEEALSGYNIPVLKNRTVHREVYAKTASEGLTVHSDITAYDAITEITNITQELLECLE